jgi:hypothetical protein
MVKKEELMDMVINTPLEKVQGPKDCWEKNIYLEDEKVLVVGYKEEESFCEEDTEEECVTTYSWYWDLRNSETWDLIQENHDTDLTFCSPSQKEPWSDEDTFEGYGNIPNDICTWSDQNQIEDIAEDIVEEVRGWLDKT